MTILIERATGGTDMTMYELFEKFCDEYNLHYNFDFLGKGNVYMHTETYEAFLIFKYSRGFRNEQEESQG